MRELERIVANMARSVFTWKPGLSAPEKICVIEIASVCIQCQIFRFGLDDPTTITRITMGTLNGTTHWLLKEKDKPAPRSFVEPVAPPDCPARMPTECVFFRLADIIYPAMRIMRNSKPTRFAQCAQMFSAFEPGSVIERGGLHPKTQQRAMGVLRSIMLRIATRKAERDQTYKDVVDFLEGSCKQGSQAFSTTIAGILTYAPFDPCTV